SSWTRARSSSRDIRSRCSTTPRQSGHSASSAERFSSQIPSRSSPSMKEELNETNRDRPRSASARGGSLYSLGRGVACGQKCRCGPCGQAEEETGGEAEAAAASQPGEEQETMGDRRQV